MPLTLLSLYLPHIACILGAYNRKHTDTSTMSHVGVALILFALITLHREDLSIFLVKAVNHSNTQHLR